MHKIPIVLNSNHYQIIETKINTFSYVYIDFSSTDPVFELLKFMKFNKYEYIVIVENNNSLNNKVLKYLEDNVQNIGNIDLYQIAGGAITLKYLISLFQNLVYTVPLILPISFYRFIFKILITFNISNFSKKYHTVFIMNKYKQYIKSINKNDLYFSNRIHWNLVRPNLNIYLVSRNWLEKLNFIYDSKFLTFERANIALSRSGNFKVSSKLFLFK